MQISGIAPGQPEEAVGGGVAGGPAGPRAGGSGFGSLLHALAGSEAGAGQSGAGTKEEGATDGSATPTAIDAAALEALAAAALGIVATAVPVPAAQTTATASSASVVVQQVAGAVAAPGTQAAAGATAGANAEPAATATEAAQVAATATAEVAAAGDAVPPPVVGAKATPVADAASVVQVPNEGKEPGSRETQGGVVVAGSRAPGHGETPEVPRTGNAGPSAPSSLPSSASTRPPLDGDPSGGSPSQGGGNPSPGATADGAHARGDGKGATRSELQPAPETFSAAPVGQGEVRPGNGANRAGTPHVDDAQAVPTVTASNTSHAAVAHAESGAPAASDTTVAAPPPHPPRAAEPAPPAPAASAPAGAVDLDRLLALGRLRPVARDDGGEMRLHVNSEGLGQIEVRVVVREDGVQASLMATQDHARHALESHRPSLEAMLGRANLRLEGFSVGLGQNPQGHENERGDAQRTLPGGTPAAAPALAASPLAEPAVAAGGLNLRV